MPSRLQKKRSLSETSIQALMRLLSERGLSEDEIDKGLQFVEASGVYTMRESFELAMSRALYTDVQLAEGKRYVATE